MRLLFYLFFFFSLFCPTDLFDGTWSAARLRGDARRSLTDSSRRARVCARRQSSLWRQAEGVETWGRGCSRRRFIFQLAGSWFVPMWFIDHGERISLPTVFGLKAITRFTPSVPRERNIADLITQNWWGGRRCVLVQKKLKRKRKNDLHGNLITWGATRSASLWTHYSVISLLLSYDGDGQCTRSHLAVILF